MSSVHFPRRRDRLRRRAGSFAVDHLFRGLSRAGRLAPQSRPEHHHLETFTDIAYQAGGSREHLLDIYRPKNASGRLPIVLYVHGGGFRILSKDTHWLFPLMFARQGYLTFNINYRLAPKAPFPAAVEDTAAAYAWILQNAASYGGDPEQIVVVGESAGGNLVAGLTVAACVERAEPWALQVYETGVVPKACIPFCGMLQVSDVERFSALPETSTFVRDRLHEVASGYLDHAQVAAPRHWDFADPLCMLEQLERTDRPLPPFFIPAGDKDVLVEDSQRLKKALENLGAYAQAPIYSGEIHAFMAFIWRQNARRCWNDTFAFLTNHTELTPPTPAQA